ncbi:putative transmembrane protein [Toxoplasma gondii CAST]|uniref:Putative transmembrane protein n=1 Tax=Toxoplasma gondii CAST TaxID=943122 RepID=A0A425HTM5_TOXGO|nr:putative transmembrane protein [Toxoplasma gondii CAST]
MSSLRATNTSVAGSTRLLLTVAVIVIGVVFAPTPRTAQAAVERRLSVDGDATQAKSFLPQTSTEDEFWHEQSRVLQRRSPRFGFLGRMDDESTKELEGTVDVSGDAEDAVKTFPGDNVDNSNGLAVDENFERHHSADNMEGDTGSEMPQGTKTTASAEQERDLPAKDKPNIEIEDASTTRDAASGGTSTTEGAQPESVADDELPMDETDYTPGNTSLSEGEETEGVTTNGFNSKTADARENIERQHGEMRAQHNVSLTDGREQELDAARMYREKEDEQELQPTELNEQAAAEQDQVAQDSIAVVGQHRGSEDGQIQHMHSQSQLTQTDSGSKSLPADKPADGEAWEVMPGLVSMDGGDTVMRSKTETNVNLERSQSVEGEANETGALVDSEQKGESVVPVAASAGMMGNNPEEAAINESPVVSHPQSTESLESPDELSTDVFGRRDFEFSRSVSVDRYSNEDSLAEPNATDRRDDPVAPAPELTKVTEGKASRGQRKVKTAASLNRIPPPPAQSRQSKPAAEDVSFTAEPTQHTLQDPQATSGLPGVVPTRGILSLVTAARILELKPLLDFGKAMMGGVGTKASLPVPASEQQVEASRLHQHLEQSIRLAEDYIRKYFPEIGSASGNQFQKAWKVLPFLEATRQRPFDEDNSVDLGYSDYVDLVDGGVEDTTIDDLYSTLRNIIPHLSPFSQGTQLRIPSLVPKNSTNVPAVINSFVQGGSSSSTHQVQSSSLRPIVSAIQK